MMQIKDGIVITYCKDGVVYPVILNQEQDQTVQFLIGGLISPLKVVFDYPIGKAINLVEGKNNANRRITNNKDIPKC